MSRSLLPCRCIRLNGRIFPNILPSYGISFFQFRQLRVFIRICVCFNSRIIIPLILHIFHCNRLFVAWNTTVIFNINYKIFFIINSCYMIPLIFYIIIMYISLFIFIRITSIFIYMTNCPILINSNIPIIKFISDFYCKIF